MEKYDLTIIGGGPAGVAAGVYAARKKIRTVVVTKTFGGQSVVSDDIQNWIGDVSISGINLSKRLKAHLLAYANGDVKVMEGKLVETVSKSAEGFETKLGSGETILSKTILITTGSKRRKLAIKGADEYENKGITYCASCDGPLFAGKDVTVIGGGNAALETAAQLAAYCRNVTILQRSGQWRADPVTVEKVLAKPNISAVLNTELLEIKGGKFVSAISYRKTDTNEIVELPTTGIFVEIGHVPATDFVKNLLKTDEWGHIVVDPKTQRTSQSGVWAAGDATDGLYHQNNIAAGDAVKALEDIYLFLHTR
ncbi:MAG: hypothetical protein A3G59_02700 [Candidatus Taylorbacteria bacterium RIFCSPLOWO2_12_FULL_47_20]|uniref:FAD/NAD(P)-binding domain-containing protein n=2 Tax=Candidatus Tayloriibacteriota TaxID=1817919 RepID=A0A1G2PA44_9BACT|nr:MAG: hypothetical protein A3H68_01150 [Candidatus Taylorbacteria bacterium RIFCSPLOWO2_02_FULL_46_40]OHA45143.1 MAG: hypothetical protein A3G59_02700 [Candidatus Taylorbacteria bacterium RIFCSPLOWO2_12_FULL_47_20]